MQRKRNRGLRGLALAALLVSASCIGPNHAVGHLAKWNTEIDGKWGKNSQKALEAFREQSASETSGDWSEADWEAVFDAYDLELADKLVTDPGRLSSLRAQIRFTEPAFLGCSEHWPTERPEAPDTEAADRRVDVLFFAEDALPDLPGSPPGAAIYGEGAYERNYMSVDDAFKEEEPPYGNAPFEDVYCPYKTVHTVGT